MKILIIEDEKPLSESVVEYLTTEGHLCEAVYSFEDEIEKIELYQYDCAIVDINLPDGSGLEIIKNIKEKLCLINKRLSKKSSKASF